MNSNSFSAHSDEREVLLMEGAPIAVIGCEEVLIDNSHLDQSFWNNLNGKKITVVYMFHPSGFGNF